ncbi:MAG: hypothetical protein GQ564_15145 [Bacteroidales bacterium]|nr:hypothetical protein [Bacteroidales bacterium]
MKNTVEIDLVEVKNSCFVVMPFNSLYQSEYENIILPALNELNIECIRGDEIYSKQRIMDDIWLSIRNCRFVLAELTGRNPNVLYEVGLAHAIGKPVIVITRNGEDVPFDLKDLRYLYYDVNDPFWGDNLKKGIKSLVSKVLENPDLEKYLEGISKSPSIAYPKISYKKTSKKTSKKIMTISGSWIGSFELNGYHDITLNIEQEEETLSANAIITVQKNEHKDVVQQLMSGKIDDKKATLSGVNYSFVKRDRLENYMLDSFEFTEIDENVISGIVTDSEKDFNGEIKLIKNVT